MKHPLALALAVALTATAPTYAKTPKADTAVSAQAANPFSADSPLSLHYPQFDKIKDSDFAPAFDAGMAQQLKEIDAIANNPAKPTFDNTILELEKSGRTLNRAVTVFFNLVGTDTNPTPREAAGRLRAEVLRAPRRHQPQRQAVRPREGAARQPHLAGPGPAGRAPGRALLHRFRPRRRQPVRHRQGAPEADQLRAGRAGHQVQPERAGRGQRLGHRRRHEGRAGRLLRRADRRCRRGRQGPQAGRQVRHRAAQHHRPAAGVVADQPRPARAHPQGVGRPRQPRQHLRQHRASSPRSPRCAPSARR